MRIPAYRQSDANDCGPTCLRIVARAHGKSVAAAMVRERCGVTREGVTLAGISDAAESLGLRTLAARISYNALAGEAPLPCIAHWRQNHFVVIWKARRRHVHVVDPAAGFVTYSRDEFLREWACAGTREGIVLLLEPTPAFVHDDTDTATRRRGMLYVLSYLAGYRRLLTQLVLGVLVGSVLTLLFPFLTQAIVDIGITNQDLGFVYTVLLAQLMLFLSQTAVEFIRGWILLHIGARVNIAIVADFLTKLMRLPMSFFDARTIGDMLQRIGDHRRIERFLTSSSLLTAFSSVNLLVFAAVLALYSPVILAVYAVAMIAALAWMLLFMPRRRALDAARFARQAETHNALVQMIQGVAELKLTNSERAKRWEWEHVQATLFKLNIKSLALSQYQQAGMMLLLTGKDIIISFLAAREVIEGRMTLGMMLAVQYMIGQMNSPVARLIEFLHSWQDASLSAERLAEVHALPDEASSTATALLAEPGALAIHVRDLQFTYPGAATPALEGVTLTFPARAVTAIVGASGSGKTTLLKLLLRFYEPTRGGIVIGDAPLPHLDSAAWRRRCGVVMQDGYLFSDTLLRNITLGDETPDRERFLQAARLARVDEFVRELPLGYATRVGADGLGLSQGQKQRILIARAVYRSPDFVFLDEATSALDACNERLIMHELQQFFAARTVLIIAHRLSTVMNAGHILVLDRGRICEQGTHAALVAQRGAYFALVRDQLDLGA
jgi:ATP-binding cassette subfamily B protein